MLKFGESVSFDSKLARFDAFASKAHAKMLARSGIIKESEAKKICDGLDGIISEVESGKFKWDTALEDVHMNIEQALTKRVKCASKLHAARSRNDQVATDMRLFFKFACSELSGKLERAMKSLVELAERNSDVVMPGYTHMQRAQPVSAAHWILAWVEMLSRDMERFGFAYQGANVCPIGSGAIAGTTLPTDRIYEAKLLGFTDEGGACVTQNSMDAVSDRDPFLEFAFACAACGTHLSRIAEDAIIWNTSEFGFVKLPDAFTTGSSLMPQKKNPDAFELLRGKSARLIGNMSSLFSLVKGLPLTYDRDLQEDKPPVFDSFEQLSICLDVLAEMAEGMEFDKKRCLEAASDPLLLATDLADYFVVLGVPFREAHHMVGKLVAISEAKKVPINKLSDSDVLKICPKADKGWRGVFDLKRAFEMREKIGMPGRKTVADKIASWKKILG